MTNWHVGCELDGPDRKGAVVHLSKGSPIVFLGMNKAAFAESVVLRRGNAAQGGVCAIINGETKTSDLATRLADRNTVKDLVQSWCLKNPSQANKVVDLIEKTAWGRAKALLFRIAEVYAQAENGRRRMTRVALSGECFGTGLFSREHASTPVTLDFDDFIEIGAIFPAGAGEVKHLLVSACSSGFRNNIGPYHRMFPKLLTIMAYASKAPSGRMAQSDASYWELHTRKETTTRLAFLPKRRDPKHPDGEHWIKVATWSVASGYGVDEDSLAELLGRVKRMEPAFRACVTGDAEPSPDPETGVPHDYFRLLMELANRRDYEEDAERPMYAVQLEQTKRLRYWSRVRSRFGAEYGATLRGGYSAAHLELPDFGALTRRELASQITAVQGALNGRQSRDSGSAVFDIGASMRLLRGLQDLEVAVIPQSWLE